MAWTGLIRVDGKTFTWLGAPEVTSELANQTAFEYTSSKSIFTIEVDDKVSLKASFISPLTPEDIKRQSLIASYLHVDVASLDGSDHDVQLYTDISAGTLSPQNFPITRFRTAGYDSIRHVLPTVRDLVLGVVLCLKQY